MHLLGNLIWLLCGGLIGGILWFVAGILCCLTVVGIPFGLQCFKMASFVFFPFGRQVDTGGFGLGGLVGNILWLLLLGWELFLFHLVFGVILCLTLIGIPFGKQHFKLGMLSFAPFGARITVQSWI